MRIRERRTIIGLSQQQLGKLIGVTLQQAFKYERGINSISAGRLYEIANELRTPIEYFFEGLEKMTTQQLPLPQRRLLDIMRNIGEIKSDKRREAISQLVRSLASD
jgi:transcriptional regulator with XRE-family HTH domain